MHKLDKIRYFIIFLIWGINLSAKESKPPEYTKYVDEIVSDFARDMEKEFGFQCHQVEEGLTHSVEKIELVLTSSEGLLIDDAIKTGLYAAHKLLDSINSHEKIRPFLKEYPFYSNRVAVSVSCPREKADLLFKEKYSSSITTSHEELLEEK